MQENDCYISTILYCASAKDETTCCSDDRVKVFANGTCEWFREFRLSVSHCAIDITWFPLDNQLCELIYESRNHDSNQLYITRISPVVRWDSYSSNGEWDLLGKTLTSTTWNRPCSSLYIKIMLKNCPIYKTMCG